MREPTLLVDTGIDDWTYIAVVAAVSFGFTGLFAAWGYYWQVKGRQRNEIRKAKKRALLAGNSSEEDPMLDGPMGDKPFPSTGVTEEAALFQSLDQTHEQVEAQPRMLQPNARVFDRSRGVDGNASQASFYSDLELFAHQRPGVSQPPSE